MSGCVRPAVTGGSLLSVRVTPGSGRSAVVGVAGHELRVRVSSPPVDGRANDEVLSLIAAAVGVRRRQVDLVTGHQSRSKVVWVDLGVDETVVALNAALSRSSPPNR